MNLKPIFCRTTVLVGTLAYLALSQTWTKPYSSATAKGDCGGLPTSLNSGFSVKPVVTRPLFTSVAPSRIVKMAFFKQPNAQFTDIYVAEKGGGTTKARVLYYDGAANTLTAIGTLPNGNYGGRGVEEQGLVGIALNEKTFATDHFLYLFYCTGAGTVGSATVGFNVSRVTLDPTTKNIDFGTEKVLLHIPAGTEGRWHTSGGMQFDNAGNLYIAVGDNEALATGPGNTADLRGSILRIKPDASDPKGYTIPAGNFGEYWANQFQSQGRTTLAAEYRDTTKVKRELYIKGVRNAYSFSVDPFRPGWVEWSQCGPDAQRGETHSLTTKPAFGGWPFWVYSNGKAVRQAAKAGSYDETGEPSPTGWDAFNPATMNPTNPFNNWSGNLGADSLPPFHTPFHAYTSPSCAAGGPIIRYDGSVDNPNKMPPQLDNVVMVSDFQVGTGTNSIWAFPVNPTTGEVTGSPTNVFTMTRSGRPNLYNSVDFKQGPDGALYMIDWGEGCCNATPSTTNNGIVRITYTGTCQDPGLAPVVGATPKAIHREPVSWFQVQSGRLVLTDDGSGLMNHGTHSVTIRDINGKVLYTFTGQGEASYVMPHLATSQLYVLRAETPFGIAQQTFSAL